MLLQPEGQPLAVGRTAEIYEWEKGKVIKLFYDWYPLSSVEREAKIARIIYEGGLSVPEFGDVLVFGERLGMVFEKIEGSTMDQQIKSNPLSGFKQIIRMARLHAQIHRCSASELPPYSSYLSRCIRHTKEFSDKEKSLLLGQIERFTAENQLCHADLHPQNIILSDRGPVIIDWANAVSGSPAADVARSFYLLSEALPPGDKTIPSHIRLYRKLLAVVYLRHYFRINPAAKKDFFIWQTVIAAARLSEGIQEEHSNLLNLVHSGVEEWC